VNISILEGFSPIIESLHIQDDWMQRSRIPAYKLSKRLHLRTAGLEK
jgi:hypothetical protein